MDVQLEVQRLLVQLQIFIVLIIYFISSMITQNENKLTLKISRLYSNSESLSCN